MQTMNERVRIIRTFPSVRLTQTDFGAKIGLKQAIIGQIENGSRNLTDRNIELICEKFSVSREWLVSGSGEMFVVTSASLVDQLCDKYDLGEVGKIVLDTFVELPPDQRAAILDYAGRLMLSAVDQYDAIRAELLDDTAQSFAARHGRTDRLQEAADLYDKNSDATEE